MYIFVLLLSVAAAVLWNDTAVANCDVFPPSYDVDASQADMSEFENKLEAWKAAGCASAEVARQDYYQSLVDACVSKLPIPLGFDDPATGEGPDTAVYLSYQKAIRDCEQASLATAASAQFAGTPPTLVTTSSP